MGCPYCKVITISEFLSKRDYARCTSKLNPDVNKKGDIGITGTNWARCRDGLVVQGVGFKDCPYYKKKTTRRR